jgi:hypothetical protein
MVSIRMCVCVCVCVCVRACACARVCLFVCFILKCQAWFNNFKSSLTFHYNTFTMLCYLLIFQGKSYWLCLNYINYFIRFEQIWDLIRRRKQLNSKFAYPASNRGKLTSKLHSTTPKDILKLVLYYYITFRSLIHINILPSGIYYSLCFWTVGLIVWWLYCPEFPSSEPVIVSDFAVWWQSILVFCTDQLGPVTIFSARLEILVKTGHYSRHYTHIWNSEMPMQMTSC